MASFRCCDNSDVIVTLIITKFILILYSCGGSFSKSLLMATKFMLNLGGIDPAKPTEPLKVPLIETHQAHRNAKSTVVVFDKSFN